jgi:hypothetical protein
MHDGRPSIAQCSADLLVAYNQLNAAIPTSFQSNLLGGGASLNAGVHSVGSAATLDGNLILNGQNNPDAVFIFQIGGAFSVNAKIRSVIDTTIKNGMTVLVALTLIAKLHPQKVTD